MKSGPLPYTDHEIFLLIVLIHFQSPGKGMAFMPWLVFLFQSSTLCHSILASKYFDYFLIPGNTFVLFHLFGVQIRFFFFLGSPHWTYTITLGSILFSCAFRISCTSPFIKLSPMDCNHFSLSGSQTWPEGQGSCPTHWCMSSTLWSECLSQHEFIFRNPNTQIWWY